MKSITEGILIGRDHFGRGILLTPEGEYRHAFVFRDAQPGEIIRYGTTYPLRAAMALSAALMGAACVLIAFAISISAATPAKIARGFYPKPPRDAVHATLYLKSRSGDPVALDLDRQGHVVMVRVLGERIARNEIIGRTVSDVLRNQDRLLAGIEVEPGEPLGLQMRQTDMTGPFTGKRFDLRSMILERNDNQLKSV